MAGSKQCNFWRAKSFIEEWGENIEQLKLALAKFVVYWTLQSRLNDPNLLSVQFIFGSIHIEPCFGLFSLLKHNFIQFYCVCRFNRFYFSLFCSFSAFIYIYIYRITQWRRITFGVVFSLLSKTFMPHLYISSFMGFNLR